MDKCLGIINLDENGNRMQQLVEYRPLASVPFGGRYRIIDFVLSNMTNSGVWNIGIFTKNRSRSLMDHLSNGRPWDLHRKIGGLKVFNFGNDNPTYEDATNFAENLEFIDYSSCEYIILSSSYMICNIDYSKVLKKHKINNNDITIVYKNVSNAEDEFIECDILDLDEEGLVNRVYKNKGDAENANISMEMYVMNVDTFKALVNESVTNKKYRKIKDCIHNKTNELKIGSYEFKGYLSCINSIRSYYKANMDLLDENISNELFFSENPIYTKVKDEPPTQYSKIGNVKNSILANGCYIEGNVKNSVIFRNVQIEKGVELDGCVVLQNSIINSKAKLKNVITDKGAIIPEGEELSGTVNFPFVIES